MRRSRSGCTTSWRSGTRAGPPRMNAAATIAPATHAPPSAKNAGRVPPRTGRTAAPSAPPIGIAVCRIPSARPSSPEGNQAMIARPLAAFTLAPSAPAAMSAATSEPSPPVSAAPPSATPAPTSPAAITQRSSNRSATRPHGRSVNSIPMPIAASTTPVSPSESRERVRVGDVDAGGVQVARVETEAQARMPVEPFVQRRQLFDRAPDRPAGARGVLHQQPGLVRAQLEHLLHGGHGPLETVLEARAEMRADVEDNRVGADRARDLHRVPHRGDRLLVHLVVRGGE